MIDGATGASDVETGHQQMNADGLLQKIGDYCRRKRLAETTFGRLVVNDGKLINRLRRGGRITTVTLDRIMAYIAADPATAAAAPALTPDPARHNRVGSVSASGVGSDPMRNFRFFDNRQKYLLFVNTCSEKGVVARRIARELANVHPRPPALRMFDAGVGDGTVMTRVMRAMHERYPTMPFYIVGKEISLEDLRLVLEKMPDRLFEHPATVLVLPTCTIPRRRG